MSSASTLLPALSAINRRLCDGVSLSVAARQAGRSRFQFHRLFRREAGETLKKYTLRLQLERAAARLLAGNESVLALALANGFVSHEVFTRAFRRHFGWSPAQYRRSSQSRATNAQRLRSLALTDAIGPCVHFYHYSLRPCQKPPRSSAMPLLSIARKEIGPQPMLFIRRRISRDQLKDTLGDCFGKLFMHGHKAGLPIAGWPFARYVSMGPGLWTVDAGMPLASSAEGEGEMQAGTLPGGPVAVGIHAGAYEELPESNAAVERWIEANGFNVGGAPWETYATDPAQHPDPADWRTEIYWPLAD